MSTTTPNFNFVKPQLTDTADITAMNPNWDTIDNELKSHDDDIASLNDAINNLDASTLSALSSALPTITDADTSIAYTNPTGIKIERWDKTTLNTPYTQGLTTRSDGVVITAVIKGTFATQLSFPIGGRGLYIRHNIVGSIYAWTEYGDFKADGSVPMTGEVLTMSNGEGSIENNGISASIRVRNVANDDSNSVQFILDNSFRTAPYRKLLLRETVDGVKTDYRLYGEHNKPTASDIGAFDANDVGGVHNIRTYTSLSQLGITELSETDALANFVKIIQGMSGRSMYWEQFSSSSNFAKSIKAKIKADCNFDLTTYYDIRCEKTSSNILNIYVTPIYANASMYYKREYVCCLRYTSETDATLTPFTLLRGRGNVLKGTFAPSADGYTYFNDGDIWLQYE